jgi:glutamine amidotransferase
MITIVDYGLGNIQAFLNVYKRLNIAVKAAHDEHGLADATKLILPGVGAFDHAMDCLEQSGLRASVDDLVLRQRVPVLGVCVGMQILADSSDEGSRRGLGWIGGHVRSLESVAPAQQLPLPHMGWNEVQPTISSPLFDQLETGARFYFLHSFHFECARRRDVLAVSSYGGDFTSAIHAGNIYGVQFHPEKSHHFGTRLLQNFAAL